MGIMSLFTNPANAILEAKKTRSMGSTMLVLLISALLLAILVGIVTALTTRSSYTYGYYSGYGGNSLNTAAVGIVVIGAFTTFMAVFLGGLFAGYLISVAMRTLGGTGGFFEGLTTIAYALYVPSIALFIMGLLAAGAAMVGGMGVVMIMVGMVVLMWGVILGIATFYRSLKELFSTDMVTALVGGTIMSAPAGIMVWAVMTMMPYMMRPIYTMGMGYY